MFRLFRQLKRDEFIVVFGDTSQGGEDSNFGIFMSKTYRDVPMVMQKHGVAAQCTPFYRDALHWIFKQTGVKPVVCLERNYGGASEMHNLMVSNTEGFYTIYYSYKEDGRRSDKPGWDTTEVSRSRMLGDYLVAYNTHLIRHYDQETLSQHQTFIVNRNGKPEAAPNTHDDAVMSSAGAYQMLLTENPDIGNDAGVVETMPRQGNYKEAGVLYANEYYENAF